MNYLNNIIQANSRPNTGHLGIDKEKAKQLAILKRKHALESGQPVPVAHMAGSFGFK